MNRILFAIIFLISIFSFIAAQAFDDKTARMELVKNFPELVNTAQVIKTVNLSPDAYIFIIDKKEDGQSRVKQLYLVDGHRGIFRALSLGDFEEPIIGAYGVEPKDTRRIFFISTHFMSANEIDKCLAHPGNYAYYIFDRANSDKPRLMRAFEESCEGDLKIEQTKIEKKLHFVPLDAY